MPSMWVVASDCSTGRNCVSRSLDATKLLKNTERIDNNKIIYLLYIFRILFSVDVWNISRCWSTAGHFQMGTLNCNIVCLCGNDSFRPQYSAAAPVLICLMWFGGFLCFWWIWWLSFGAAHPPTGRSDWRVRSSHGKASYPSPIGVGVCWQVYFEFSRLASERDSRTMTKSITRRIAVRSIRGLYA